MTLFSILDLIYYGFTLVIVLPIWLGIRYWPDLSVQERRLVEFLGIMLLLEIVSTILRYSSIRNHFIDYFRTLAVLWIGAGFYSAKIGWESWPLRLSILVMVLIPVEVFEWVGMNHINSLTRSLAWLFLALYSYRRFMQMLSWKNTNSLRQQPMIYYDSGLFLMSFVSAGTKYFENYFIETSLDLYFFFDTFTVIINSVAYYLFARGLILKHRITGLKFVS